jgi:hypothetical protein
MKIKVRDYYTLTARQKDEFFKFLSTTDKTSPASVNMWDKDWQNKSNTLPYILDYTDRYFESRGSFHILYDDSRIFACGGVYKSNFDNEIAIAGSRTYIDSQYRNKSILREYLLPYHKDWARKHNCKIVALSFNEYNKNIVEIFKRRRLGETIDRVNTRNKKHLFFNGVTEVGFPVTIQYTKQYVIYEQLEQYNFDWESIKWQE